MPNNPNPTDAANAAFQDSWSKFMEAHNRPKRGNYADVFTAPDKDTFNSAYEKFLRAAEFPDTYTAVIPLTEFSQDELTAILLYLDKTKVHSSMEWGKQPNTQQLTIRNGNNAHLDNSPIPIIRDQQLRLSAMTPDFEIPDEPEVVVDFELPDDTPVAQAQAAPKEALYIPPFNTLTTPKGAYVLLEHMYFTEVEALSEALQSRGITFDKDGYDSPSYGQVFVVRFNMEQYEELGRMMKEARTQENREKAPDGARIYPRTKGDPAINVLEGMGEKHIPFDGLMPNQMAALEARLNKAEIPFTLKMHTEHGPVLAVAEKYEDELEVLRFTLRAEHNARKSAASAAPAGPFSSPTPA